MPSEIAAPNTAVASCVQLWACVTPMAAVRNASAAAAVTRSFVLFMVYCFKVVNGYTNIVPKLFMSCMYVVPFMSIQCTNIVPKF